MIGAVYKGIMKAVGKRVSGWLDFYSLKCDGIQERPYEWYLAEAEKKAYEEICKAFRIGGGVIKFRDIDSLKSFVEEMASRMGCSKGSVTQGTESLEGVEYKYVSLRMPNRVWKFHPASTSVWMSTLPISVCGAYPVCRIAPHRELSAILPDLDRMYPVLERMTRNLFADAAREYKARQIENK